MSRIYWDTMLFIYWIEDHPIHSTQVQEIYARMQKRRDVLCASALTLGEVLTGLLKRGAIETAAEIRTFFGSSAVEVSSFTRETAEHFARIRATHRVSPADAIHLACAAQSGADLFLTHDRRLKGLMVPGIDFIAGMDVDLL
ncbi:MAG TPA: PIN domain-containing protein [Bryobacteraceae bacterium]|jgi:predicted nucleic acid-binding protein